MRILLVGKDPSEDRAGMSRYADMLCRNLRSRGHLVEMVSPGGALRALTRIRLPRRWLRYMDRVLFPLKLRGLSQGFDLVHVCDQADAMYLAHTGGVPASITCHDLLDISIAQGKIPEMSAGASFGARQRKLLRHLQDAKNVVCVSWKTSRELGAMREAGGQRRVVIPNAVELDPGTLSEQRACDLRSGVGLGQTQRYLLHVGSECWYRNRPGVLRIFRRIQERVDGLKLVMAGAPLTSELREFVAANLPQGSVLEAPDPGPDGLLALYLGAEALLFPSLYEGFGWPIAEAQSCGCPVITSNYAPMSEVAGSAALFIDPRDEAGAAEAIVAELGRLPNLREAGFENAKRFRPVVVFAGYEGFFKGVLRTRRATDVVIAANEAETMAGESREG